MNPRVNVIIFEGGSSLQGVVGELTRVRQAVVLDTILKLKRVAGINEIILCTNYPTLAKKARALEVTLAENALPFHFGRALQAILAKHPCDGLICLGGASAPLMSVEEFSYLADSLTRRAPVVITNNPQSADIVAIAPARLLLEIEAPENDNNLASIVKQRFQLPGEFIPHSIGAHFDLDTPNDALIMACSPHTGQLTREALEALSWDSERLQRALGRMRETHCELALIGRVSPVAVSQLNRWTFLRLRVFSEERGMKALNREASGSVVSLLGHFVQAVGVAKFFSDLSQTCDVCFFDTRVLFAHRKLRLSEEERFLSDLGRWEAVDDPWVREFTHAAITAEVPVILGGHSLVSGGLWLLAEHLACRNNI